MPQQKCPEVERLQVVIKGRRETQTNWSVPRNSLETFDEYVEVTEALEWLKDFLLTRRNYQRKQQVKRRVLTKMMAEHGFAAELDERIAATYGNDLERFDDNNSEED